MTEPSPLHRLLRGGSWAFFGKVATYPLGLALTMLLTRLLNPQDMGGYFLAMSTIMLSAGLVQAGVGLSMSKAIAASLASDNPRGVRGTLRIGGVAFAVTSLAAALLFSLGPGEWLLASLRDGDRLIDSLGSLTVLVLSFAAIGHACEILRGFHALNLAALLDQQLIFRIFLLLGLALPLAAGTELPLPTLLSYSAAAGAMATLASAAMLARVTRGLGHEGSALPRGQILGEAPTFLLVRVNNWLLNGAAIWILGLVRPLEEAALFGGSNTLALLVLAPWQVVGTAAGPTLTALHARGQRAQLQQVLRTVSAIAALPAVALSVVLLAFGDRILTLLFTPEYAAGFWTLAILASARAASTLLGIPMTLLSMTQHGHLVRRNLYVLSALTVLLYFLAAREYGAPGVALVSGGSAIVQALLFACISHRVEGLNTLPQLSAHDLRTALRALRT